MKTVVATLFVIVGVVAGCANDSGDCGDPVVGSESHWANCAENSSTNNTITNNSNGGLDAGASNNQGANNVVTTNNATTGNNTAGDAGQGPDAGSDAGSDAGQDMGTPEPDTCYAFRWNATDLNFDEARCTEQDDGTFLCTCFDAGQTQSIALACPDALGDCGATIDEVGGCAMTNEAGCIATDNGWDCTCQGIDGVFPSTAQRCDAAYYESCYADQFCVAEIGPGLEGRCTPSLDENYAATGFVCGCYRDGEETIAPFVINRETCAEAAPLACGE